MAEPIKGPLDEVQWNDPTWIAHFQGVSAENIHLYFMWSPFCDPTSNNKLLDSQARFNPDLARVVENRQLLEERLRTMPGTEYVVVDGPETTTPNMNPTWVIRKQIRRKYKGEEDSLDILGTYYVRGDNIYQAPSFLDILTCRLSSIAVKLQDIHDTAANMQFFSPAQGHTTLKASSKASTSKADAQAALRGSAVPSLRNSPTRAASPGAESVAPSHTGLARDNQQDQELSEENELLRSLQASIAYGDDYLDLNPIVGEPGSFKFQSTQQHAREQAAAKRAAAEKKKAVPLLQPVSTKTSTAPTPAPSGVSPTTEKPQPTRKASRTPKTGNKTLKRKTTEV